MSYKKSYFLLSIGVIVGAVVVFIGLGLGMKIGFLGNAVAFIGLVAMLGGIMQALIFFKCPKCGMLLKSVVKSQIVVMVVGIGLTYKDKFSL